MISHSSYNVWSMLTVFLCLQCLFGVGVHQLSLTVNILMELDVYHSLQRYFILRRVLVSNFLGIRVHILYGGIHYHQAYSMMLLFMWWPS